MATNLTIRQTQILEYLTKYFKDNNRMPSMKEIEYDCKISKGSTNRILAKLTAYKKLQITRNSIKYKLV